MLNKVRAMSEGPLLTVRQALIRYEFMVQHTDSEFSREENICHEKTRKLQLPA